MGWKGIKNHLVPILYCGQGHIQLDQCPVQHGPEQLHIHRFYWQSVREPQHSLSKEFTPNISSKILTTVPRREQGASMCPPLQRVSATGTVPMLRTSPHCWTSTIAPCRCQGPPAWTRFNSKTSIQRFCDGRKESDAFVTATLQVFFLASSLRDSCK